MEIMISVATFVVCLVLVETVFLSLRRLRNPGEARVRKRLKEFHSADEDVQPADIVRRKVLSDVPWLNRLLEGVSPVKRLDRLIRQADVQRPAGFFILLSLVVASVGWFVGTTSSGGRILPTAFAVLFGSVPFLLLHSKKKKRMQKFQEQLPEALELVARTLKAGHAFSSGLKMVCDEMSDPIAVEFDRTLDEINFGVSVSDALKNLAARVDCPDLGYFVVATIVQRETGGNLAELIEGTSELIRERFKFFGKVRVLSAEARTGAIILIAVPFVTAAALFILNREYITTLVNDPIGHMLLGGAAVMICLGILTIRSMIRIDV
ncbi:MAG: type II secretion system F family protein [Syntrophobacteraceae bacterium]|nr:type II secretion system F family protein [Syntrophobacteraceae bacterium]